jgi:hypothetical protein
MRDLAKRRIQIAERLFDSYQFGNWNLEEVTHWHVARAGEELCRSIMLCGAELDAPVFEASSSCASRPEACLSLSDMPQLMGALSVTGSRPPFARWADLPFLQDAGALLDVERSR